MVFRLAYMIAAGASYPIVHSCLSKCYLHNTLLISYLHIIWIRDGEIGFLKTCSICFLYRQGHSVTQNRHRGCTKDQLLTNCVNYSHNPDRDKCHQILHKYAQQVHSVILYVGLFNFLCCPNLFLELSTAWREAFWRLLTIWTEMFPSARLTLGPDSSFSSTDTSWSTWLEFSLDASLLRSRSALAMAKLLSAQGI